MRYGTFITGIMEMKKVSPPCDVTRLMLGLALSFFCNAVCSSSIDSHPIVETLSGRVQGVKKTILDQEVWAYLGIPFAEPPIGLGRFDKPVTKVPWEGIFDAGSYGYACHQVIDTAFPGFRGSEMWNPNVNMSEDCLNLNVWVPANTRENGSLAVMVWIYGGGFFAGCASLDVYNGEVLSTTENVIVVTINYRVGSLGFLAMGDSNTAPGNVGLLDQVMALRWIQDNIGRFGGDPNLVTIFGESSGAVSVNFHMLSSLSDGLFTRAILQSGSSVVPWGVITKEEALRRSLLLAKNASCYETEEYIPSNDEVLDCLRKLPAEEVTAHDFVVAGTYIFPFVAVVDGDFLTETPTTSVIRGAVTQTEVLLGTNTNEGSFFMIYYLPGFNKDTDSLLNRTGFYEHIPLAIPVMNEFGRDAIAFQYTDWLDPYNATLLRDGTEAYVSDYNIVCPTHEFARFHANTGNKVYAYHFDQRAQNNEWGEWMGVMHGDEIAFVFGQPLRPGLNFSEGDARLSSKMMKLWANFAKSGNPNYEDDGKLESDVDWPLFSESSQLVYLLKDSTVTNPKSYIWDRANLCAFWEEYVPLLNTRTANIDEAERQWKEEFYQWSTKYMVDWKAEFNHYMYKKEASCSTDNQSMDNP